MPLFNSNQLTAIQDATKSAISSKSKQRNFTVNKKPIRLIELFSGIGAQSSGMDRLGANYERYKTSEWDINAVASYREIHEYQLDDERTDYSEDLSSEEILNILVDKFCISSDGKSPLTRDQVSRKSDAWRRKVYNDFISTHNIGSIMAAHADDLEIVDRDKFDYLVSYSFPCSTADTLILTKEGYKPIVEIKPGDVVLTKSNTWHPVAKFFDNGVHPTIYLNSLGFKNLHVTPNHKFWIRTKYYKYPYKEDGKRAKLRLFTEPEFKEAKDLTRNDYFGIPVIKEEIPYYSDDANFWYMMGYYCGDGYLSATGYDVRLCCNEKKLSKLEPHIQALGYKYTITDTNTPCYKLRMANKELHTWISENFGSGCMGKHIPGFVLTLPITLLKSFLDGYLDSDGSINTSGKSVYYKITSVNTQMLYSVCSIIHKVHHRPVSMTMYDYRKVEHCIDGRPIKSNYPCYDIKFKLSTDKQDKAFYEDGYIWYPYYSQTQGELEHVYNIEVEEDHSYIMSGCISKNCQSLSVAGKGEGMAKGSGTRSGLLWEVERLLLECQEKNCLPQFLLMENVPQVHGTKHIKDFKLWIEQLRNLGYVNYFQDLNAKDYGVAQNRDRCFMVSILKERGNVPFKFPEPFPLEKVMKDYLSPEEEVDEKYYIKSKKAKELIEKLIADGTIPEEPDTADCP